MRIKELEEQAHELGVALTTTKIDLFLVDPRGNVWEAEGPLTIDLAIQGATLKIKKFKPKG